MREILVNVDEQNNKTIVVVENGKLIEKDQEKLIKAFNTIFNI